MLLACTYYFATESLYLNSNSILVIFLSISICSATHLSHDSVVDKLNDIELKEKDIGFAGKQNVNLINRDNAVDLKHY